MQTFQSALRLSQISMSTRTIYGAVGAAAILCAAGIGYVVWKNRQEASPVPSNETKKENDDEIRRTQASDAATGNPEASVAPAPSDRGEAATAGTAGDAHGAQPTSHPTLSDKDTFFEVASALARPILASTKPTKQPEKNWAHSFDSILTTKIFKNAEPRFLQSHDRGNIVIFPLYFGAAVLLIQDKEGFVKVAYKAGKMVHMELFDPVEAAALERPADVRSQALRYVYEKTQELMKVREGKIHPLMAYPMEFVVDGANLPGHALKKAGDQVAEKTFFDRLYNDSHLVVENPWTRSNAAYISAVLNSPVVPPALEPVRHGNLDGDRFVHVSDPSGLCNLVLISRKIGVVQIARAGSVDDSQSLRAVPGYEGWFSFTNEVFDLSREDHRKIAFFINQAAAREVTEQAA